MWNAFIDNTNQQFVIEDRAGNVIATRRFPSQRFPIPSQEETMSNPQNQAAWDAIQEMVQSANKGKSR